MIKTSTIIQQLQVHLPFFTDLFSNKVDVGSLSIVGSLVTAVTPQPHGLTTNDTISIKGAVTQFRIDDATFDNGIVSVTLLDEHDFTEGFKQNVTIQGIDQVEYNGTFEIFEVPNRFKFSYKIDSVPVTPATGVDKVALYEFSHLSGGYNGTYSIDVIDPNTFTYEVLKAPSLDAIGDITAIYSSRISGAITAEQAMEAYTRQDELKLWGFVVLNDTGVSKDRNILSDAISTPTYATEYRQKVLCNFSFVVMTPSKNSILGLAERDLMEDLKPPLLKSLARARLKNVLSQDSYLVGYVGDNHFAYLQSYIVHSFDFEVVTEITVADTLNYESVAFRDINLRFKSILDEEQIIAKTDLINLDDIKTT